jgi:EF-P beta-lysylation protein EpmB
MEDFQKYSSSRQSAQLPEPRARRRPAGASWKQALAAAARDPDELVDFLGLPEGLREGARRAARLFPLRVPRDFLARMRPGDPGDPLLRQVLPLEAEESPAEGHLRDPVGDGEASCLPGMIQKYRGRALLVLSGACAVHCRYCFRRHFPYSEIPRGLEAWEPALARIASDAGLSEVILSGGDPLVLPDSFLGELARRLAAIPHLRRLRVHSRLPVVIPERVDEDLLGWLRGTRLAPVVVVHANHPAEIVGACAKALRRLVEAGIPVLNQAVLLRGVNDDLETLARLCEGLVELGVLPYYLHQMDPVQGAAHFAVAEGRGAELVAGLRERLPGYAVPRYVKEVRGARSKVSLAP